MKYIYAVIDIKARALVGPLMHFHNDNVAMRTFSELAADKASQIARYPEDYELVKLGTLYDESHYDPMRDDPPRPIDENHQPYTTIGIHNTPHGVVITGKQWLALQEKNTGA